MDDIELHLQTPRVLPTVEKQSAYADVEQLDIPILLVPGKPGPPGRDGAVVGGAVINDNQISNDSVWSSQHTHDQDNAVIASLTPDVDLILLFNNALL